MLLVKKTAMNKRKKSGCIKNLLTQNRVVLVVECMDGLCKKRGCE